MSNRDLNALRAALEAFADARQWDRYHSPKNLCMALSVEVAELTEHFQWKTEIESRTLTDAERSGVIDEVADVLLYLLQICNKLNIDPVEAGFEKMAKNALKYPV
ncbi:nucleotide pyrophosphohydrolase [Limnobacter humi]|uniref:Nucleotide pyrophosphohydrolase n=1 Tax=Limnobacter humi TaxID=1778671 RepID=A0ABT1WGG2_9BURK|nr:nucleotide pyrophosphohydrolase [Limnobacter humi]MCQ8896611.1 nucleotide pyrophosphohydrolase [Limnobacter humi]